MIKLISEGIYIKDGMEILKGDGGLNQEDAAKNTMAYDILTRHNTSDSKENLQIRFDAMASHDITYVGIIQTARASGMKEFPLPYVLTNCHNSLCAVGGTINEDDHVFGMSAAKKYGGIYVPAHHAVIHQYMREEMAKCGSMILGSDSHTRYGALGTMAIGEGGPELVKQLMKRTYDVAYPGVVAIYLDGKPRAGVGPQDVALSIIGAVFKEGFVKNKVMEFVGPGIQGLSMDYRNGIDVMTTETTCLTSIWCTDETVADFYDKVGRADDYKELRPQGVAYYDGMVHVDLSQIEPMIALPFHPSNVYKISEVQKNAKTIFEAIEKDFKAKNPHLDLELGLVDKIKDGKVHVDQGIIAGCAGGLYEFIYKAADILNHDLEKSNAFNLSVYPASEAVHYELIKAGVVGKLLDAGATMKTAFCGPCFGAGDVPSHQSLSIRHTTRNFPNREGSKPSDGQIASVALMDALSIAATAANGGVLTSAMEMDLKDAPIERNLGTIVNKLKVYNGFGNPQPEEELILGPNITDWPEMRPLTENLVLQLASVIHDEVTTTDELIPSGETSSLRSNPLKLSEFTLSRKDPDYVGRAKAIQKVEYARRTYMDTDTGLTEDLQTMLEIVKKYGVDISNPEETFKNLSFGSVVFARKPGDGSAREQAASCQRVLGGVGNIALEYATKRYRSNLVNWGMIPFVMDEVEDFNNEDLILVKGIKTALETGQLTVEAKLIQGDSAKDITLKLEGITQDESDIILDGCLINYYRKVES